MAPKPKAPQLIQQYVTGGDRSLRDWHLLLRRVTFGAALVLMAASVVSLHWACNLIGFTGWWEPVAWAVPLAMETGMAAVASTATTIRKEPKPGREGPGAYYASLWLIFSFVMLLAQAANIGHAVSTIASRQAEIPAVIPIQAVYFFACAFAALFPLGGTMFVHVSGFLRARGTGARWIDEDSELVMVQAAPGAPTAQRAPAQSARKPAPAPARDARPAAQDTRASAPEQPQPARAESARNPEPARTRGGGDADHEAAYAAYRDARDQGREMDGNELGALLGCHAGHARNLRNKKFRPRYEAERPSTADELRAAEPDRPDPIEAQAEAERDRSPSLSVAR